MAPKHTLAACTNRQDEGYFEGLARWVVEGRPDENEVEAFYREHDNTWIP